MEDDLINFAGGTWSTACIPARTPSLVGEKLRKVIANLLRNCLARSQEGARPSRFFISVFFVIFMKSGGGVGGSG